ncbi:MAG: transposase [Bacteroidetes bacterium]|nr:transposase [Bacteroidota bacterium]MBL6963291.1 transposase [Bacteroidota bacterium]
MEQLFEDHYYHIFNHANGPENLFVEEKNYIFFLDKYKLYITPLVHTIAYCLMPNHFHMLIRVKTLKEIQAFISNIKTFPKLDDNSYL